MSSFTDEGSKWLDTEDKPTQKAPVKKSPTESFKALVNRIETLPPLSNVAQKILTLYATNDEDIDIRKLARLIESDTVLTANILAMINDPKMGFKNKITSVSQAITLF